MIAVIKHIVESIVDSVRFASAVWHDARAMQDEAQQKYNHLRF